MVFYNEIKNNSSSNLKYLTRCNYYGKLLDWEYVSGAMVLKFQVYTATEFYASNNQIRIYVPTNLEETLKRELVTGDNYFIIAAPYKLSFKKEYRHRVDMLLQIFREVI